MKKLIVIIFIALYIPLPSFADEVDEALPGDTPAQIKESVRQVIRLGVENHSAIKMTKTMLENRFREQQVVKAHEILIKAKRQNLPEDPIIDKFHEGIAKNIKADNILQAMERVRSRYETANRYALRYSGDGEGARIMAREIAECMTAGMEEGDIDRIMEMLRKRELQKDEATNLPSETLKTARTMALAGAKSSEVADVVDNALQKGYGAGDMNKMGKTFMLQARRTSSPSDLARSYSSAIKRGVKPDSLGGSVPGNIGGTGGGIGGAGGGGMGGGMGGAGGGGHW